jgi:hypothetical protein
MYNYYIEYQVKFDNAIIDNKFVNDPGRWELTGVAIDIEESSANPYYFTYNNLKNYVATNAIKIKPYPLPIVASYYGMITNVLTSMAIDDINSNIEMDLFAEYGASTWDT